MAPRVLISDALSLAAVQIFKDRGVDVDFQPGLGKDKLAAIVGKFDDGAVRATGVWTEVIPYIQSIREPLVHAVGRLNPRTLALDYSLDDHAADGLAHGMYLLLAEYFTGTPYASRFVSADRVVGALRGRKSPTEIRRIQAAIDTAERIFTEVERFAAPGRTEREIAAFMLALAKERGVEPAWSGPCPKKRLKKS